MSETSTQKLLVTMACVLGVAVVLVGYGRQRDRGFERLPLASPAAARPTTSTTSPKQPTTNQRAFLRTSPSSTQWQAVPDRTIANANSAPVRALPAHDSYYAKQGSIKDYFTPSAALDSQTSTRHPSAQKIAQRNQSLQQRTRRAFPQSTNQPVTQTRSRPTTQFHDFGNVGQAAATRPISTQNSSVGHAVAESPIPEPDSFTVHNRFFRNEASPQTVSFPKTPSTNQLEKIKTAEPEVVAKPLPRQLPQARQGDIAAKIPASEAAPVRFDRGVRKANWTEIEATPKVDPVTNFRPLQQPTLLGRRANPQVEARAREQIQYGQSLARRRAYFAAREEFIRALLLIASSYNAESNSTAHPERLAQGLIAIDELGDFTTANGALLQQKILTHTSRLLTPPDIAAIQPMQAIGLYSNFSENQIAQAIGFSPAGSEALHALGKLESMVPEADRNQVKTFVFYRAAIKVNPSNTVCANDLGVLLFNMGRLEESESALRAAIGSSQSQLSWNNLAMVHSQRAAHANSQEERDRQLSLARLAAQQSEKFAVHPENGQPNRDGLNSTQWATPNEFQNNAAFPNAAIQHSDNRGPANTSKLGPSRSATLKQKMKDWF